VVASVSIDNRCSTLRKTTQIVADMQCDAQAQY
jgi:hypothetical protein